MTLNVKIPAGVDSGVQLCLQAKRKRDRTTARTATSTSTSRSKTIRSSGGEDAPSCRVPITCSAGGARDEDRDSAPRRAGRTGDPGRNAAGRSLPSSGQGDTRSARDPRGRKGDLHVEIELIVPKKLSEEHEGLPRKLAEVEKTQVTPHQKTWYEKLKDLFKGETEEAQ